MEKVRVAAVQFQHEPGDKKANLDKVAAWAERAAAKGVQIAVFPECCISGYWHLRKLTNEEMEAIAEPVFEGPSSRALAPSRSSQQQPCRRPLPSYLSSPSSRVAAPSRSRH